MKLSGFSKVKIVAAAAVILAAAGIGGWLYQSSVHKDTRVKASGTVEVTEIQLAPQAGGRIVEINIKAADYVKKGDLIARMSLDGSDHDAAMAEAALEAARQQLLELESGFRSEDVAKAKAETALRRTQYEQAARDAKRFKDLASDGVVSVREAELYSENAEAKRNALNMAQDTLSLLQNGMRPEQIKAAQANVRRADAALQKANTLVGYKEFRSPADGTILTKNYEIGDVIAAGAPIATLGRMDDCWVKIFIPSTQLGLVKLGGEAEVRIDAYPKRVFKAHVTEVNEQAEYNPRLSLTQKERANMVFWIKISVDNEDGVLKPGMPADVTIL